MADQLLANIVVAAAVIERDTAHQSQGVQACGARAIRSQRYVPEVVLAAQALIIQSLRETRGGAQKFRENYPAPPRQFRHSDKINPGGRKKMRPQAALAS